MPEPTPSALVRLLIQPELRIRTGILELPLDAFGNEPDLAVQLGVGCRNLVSWKLGTLPTGRRYIGLACEQLIQDLALVLSDSGTPGYCVWISNVDLLLAGLPFRERERFWSFMFSTFRQPRGLLLSMPIRASSLLPESQRGAWAESGRLSVWSNLENTLFED